jgi:hypothetical protein
VSVGAPGGIGYAAAVSRIDQIQSQIAGLQTAFSPAAASASGGAGLTAGAGAAATGSASLGGAASAATVADGTSFGTAGASTGAPATFASALSGAMSGVPGTTGVTGMTALPTGAGATGLTALPTGAALPAGATTMLTSDQQQFASRLAAQTGLDPGVVSAWLLAEESGGAAQSRQSQGNNDWLNIGYTDGGTFGSGDSVWSDPNTAADATAGWLEGKNTIPGYGTASTGIQAVLGTAGRPPADQIAALQGSGWASSGYPSLTSLYSQVTGQPA